MSFLAFMKILESSASRYDKGISLLSLGNMNKIYDQINSYVDEGDKILDIGCGIGSLTIRAAGLGGIVKGIDINSEMLAICSKRIENFDLKENIILQEKGVAEITSEPANSFDIIMSGLCFSELSSDEINFALKESKRLLKENGVLIIIDEVVPTNIIKRILHLLIRIPVVVITYILTQTTTKAVKKLPEKIEEHNFEIVNIKYAFLGSLAFIVAKKNT